MRILFLSLAALVTFNGEMKVKKQTVYITNYVVVNGIEKVIQHKEDVLFDERGNKLGEIEYGRMGNSVIRSVRYTFNDHNQIVYRKETDFTNSFFTETSFKYHVLNDKDPAEMKEMNSRGKLVFILRREFDRSGRILKELWLDSSDTTKIETCSKFLYDDNNNSMEKVSYFEGELSANFFYKYDSLCRPIEIRENEDSFTRIVRINYTDSEKTREEWMVKNGIQSRTITEIFDLKGNALKWILYNDADQKPFEVHEFKYEYDANGLLKKRVERVNGKLKQERHYSYEYYT